MALDETTKELVRSSDAGTLLSLLPLLRSQIEQAAAEMKRVHAAQERDAKWDAEIAETYGEALTSLHMQFGHDPDSLDALRDIRDKINSLIGKSALEERIRLPYLPHGTRSCFRSD